jgi:hypothetical protein
MATPLMPCVMWNRVSRDFVVSTKSREEQIKAQERESLLLWLNDKTFNKEKHCFCCLKILKSIQQLYRVDLEFDEFEYQ